jgi:CubicO group peptidase (beta-lactamase class C family)
MNLLPLIQHVTEQNLQLRRLVVRQHGEIIAEHAFSGELPEQLWSVSKTFTSLAVGIAQEEGYFSIHDRLLTYFPAAIKPDFDQLTIRDLLCMGTGQIEDPLSKANHAGLPLDDIESLFFDEPIQHTPGTHFMYNNAATYMLSKLITLTTGQCLLDYLMPRLFQPLEINEVSWVIDSNGVSFGCAGLNLNVDDLSKVGQLMLNMGQWQGNQLVPADYIRQATRQQISTADFNEHFATADHTSGYGYQLWMNRVPGTYRMDGLYAQLVVVLPEKDAVVTMISNEPERMTSILELTWDFLIDQLD